MMRRNIENNVLGFFGIDNYDIILYLSRVLTGLGKRVLMTDYSSAQTLASCIPVPVGLAPADDIIDYRRTDFTGKPASMELFNGYDDILMFFGFDYSKDAASYCNHMVLAVDLQKFHIEKLAAVPAVKDVRKQLIIKDYISCRVNEDFILDSLPYRILKENVYLFDLDERDTACRVMTQYDAKYEFRKISREMKQYLKETLRLLHPETGHNLLENAYKLAERGN